MDKLSELQFMKDLFLTKLPMGDNRKHIDEYFSRLEELINNKENIKNDDFPDDDERFDYKYFSPSLFKERSSRLSLQPDTQDVGPVPDGGRSECDLQDDTKMSPDQQCVPVSPEDPYTQLPDIDGHEHRDIDLSG